MFRTRLPVASICIATNLLPLDLHVLSLPLAFILSQDQTLHCKCCCLTRLASLEIYSVLVVVFFVLQVFLPFVLLSFKDLLKLLSSNLIAKC